MQAGRAPVHTDPCLQRGVLMNVGPSPCPSGQQSIWLRVGVYHRSHILGNPAQRSGLADIATVVGRIVNLFSKATTAGMKQTVVRNDLLNNLSHDSDGLQELSLSARNLLSKMAVVSFYETQPTPPLSIPVRSVLVHPPLECLCSNDSCQTMPLTLNVVYLGCGPPVGSDRCF